MNRGGAGGGGGGPGGGRLVVCIGTASGSSRFVCDTRGWETDLCGETYVCGGKHMCDHRSPQLKEWQEEEDREVGAEYLKLKNIFLLPHLGSATKRTRWDMAFRATKNLEDFFLEKKPQDQVN